MPPSAQEEARESTSSWFIRALNLEPKEQRRPLKHIVGTLARAEDRVSRHNPEPGPER
jgi:hypothetical protein